MDSNSTSKKSDRLTSTSWLSRPLNALCGRASFSDSSNLGQECTSTTPSSSNSIQRCRYDVFISFRGSDTRNTFVDHLYNHLIRKGIFVFKDDKQLQKGESISPQLFQAIKCSRVSIIVFSKDYASSTWCLNEMAAIVECHRELKQNVFPVFYNVDPSQVRKQNGVYEKAFDLHAKSFKHDPHKVDKWKKAMTSLGGLVGWDVRNEPEFEKIENIVQAVIKKLGCKFLGSDDDLIGIQPRVQTLENLLKLNSDYDGCRVLGIWGMNGIGKTTLANALYDRISHLYQFDARCFIEDISKIYRECGAIAVRRQILNRTIQEKNLDAYSSSEISQMITSRLYKLKLLVVLDNVDKFEQLEELHINPKALCAGSRIIITTRDVRILQRYEADGIHEVELMDENDAHKLLCRKAFKSCDYSSRDFAKLIPKVLKYAQGLPLAIRVMGSFLYNRNTTQWRAALEGWQNNPDSGIMNVLRSSFEALELREKEIFLHIACFFGGEKKDYVRRILHACGLQPDLGISIITEKSFITSRNDEIHMHEMLQELGKQIVREQNPDEPTLWSRLWLYRDFYHAMITKSEAIKAKAIVLNQKEDVSKFNQLRDEDLSKLENLKLLILYHSNFLESPKFLSNSLCYLLWNGYPFTSLPSNFQPYHLVELNMPDSGIEQLWVDIQHFPYLKMVDLSNSKNLKLTPCFEGMENLERLDLTGCINLSVVHPSIGFLTKLVFLSLQNCTSLVNLDFGNEVRLWSLKVLRLSDCTRLENTPDFSSFSILQYLDMDRCESLSTIHESIGKLEELRFLSLRDCTNLVEIPATFNQMTSLETLNLHGCFEFKNLSLIQVSSAMQSLIYLDLSFCSILSLPEAIGDLRCLERLNLQGNNLIQLPSTLSFLHNLSYLNLSHCHMLQNLPLIPNGPSDSGGRYFKTSGSHNERSGLYIFDSPNCTKLVSMLDKYYIWLFLRWAHRLVKEPLHFRCGFDIILPWHGKTNDSDGNCFIPKFFHRFKGGSIARINGPVMDVNWLGFLFYVSFELNNYFIVSSPPHQSLSLPLPHPFYLSFENDHTEERFDMPLNLERDKNQDSKYLWMIYISQDHCHFVRTGAHITFKADRGLIVKEWGLRVLTKENIEKSEWRLDTYLPLQIIDHAEESGSFNPKIQLPYNWLVSDEDRTENDEAKGKEIDLYNLGLFTESSQ